MMSNSDFEKDLEKYKSESLGYEHEEYEDELDEGTENPFDAERIRIEQRMLSVKYIKELLENNQLELAPGFQRNKVWKENKRKSLLIESLMLRIPIPAFYFYEDENSRYYVIDGLQRLSTIEDFINNKFKLTGLQYLQEICNNKKFKDIDQKYVNRIYQTQLAVNIIDARTPPQVKFDIFRRINTGGVSLNAQEIRNSIAKPRVRKFLKEIITNEHFIKATGDVNDLRMSAQELVVRFVAFYNAYDFNSKFIKYEKGDLELFLDQGFEFLNNSNEETLELYKEKIINAMKNSYSLFGEYAYRNCSYESFLNLKRKRLLNRSLFVTWSVLLSKVKLEEISPEVKDKACKLLSKRLTEDGAYSQSLTMGTNGRKQVVYNFIIANKILEEVLTYV
ncbi:DUF262 domain-containing protein [Niallia taxi]|uniref:DUF262 domain-containing protein n=1 Tax=Niallia taxi TaxID=2499688 RepID=UPI003F5F018F